MHDPEAARPRRRSPFAAAFLSLIFPGLGQLYAGAPMRALAFAAGPVLVIALGGGLLLRVDRISLLGYVIDPVFLNAVFVINLALLVYRLVAIIDAYRVAAYLNAASEPGAGRVGRVRLSRDPLAVAGLIAVIMVMAASHVVVARYDMLAQDFLGDGCIFLSDASAQCDLDSASPSPGSSETPEPVDSEDPLATPVPESTPVGSAVPEVSIPPWDGKERLNILLVGADQRPGQGTFNTDTMIVVSIDPQSKQVTMFSLPRDTVDVPVPQGPAQNVFGSVYRNKINAWWTNIHLRSDLYPGTKKTIGFNGLKAILGNLYGLDIKYFVEVNFDGFKSIVDEMGGVTVNVQVPVSDDRYPAAEGTLRRLYIPSGIRHMDGAEALRYARSRHGSNDFDRGARQQRILLSLREQADPQDLIPKLPDLIQALKSAVSTDVPRDQLAPLLGLASQIDTKDIQSYVFSPPYYGTENLNSPRGYIIEPNVSRIRAAVRDALKGDPPDEAQRQDLAEEGAGIWVLNGTSDNGRGTRLAGFLEYHGLAASAPRQKPPDGVPANTRIVVYNGAEDHLTETIAFLEQTFGVTATYATDPAIRTDIIVTIGRNTKDLEAPPVS